MKKVRVTTAIMAIAFVSLTAMSFTDFNEENKENVSQRTMIAEAQQSNAKQVVEDYMTLKDALVATDEKAATRAAKKLESTLKNFNVSSYTPTQQKELKDIIKDATDHAEHIGKSEIVHQREHFKMLSKNITDMVALTGTDTILYKQYCPMYDGGSVWLSMSKDVKNPYYGRKMLNCGKVQKEIN